MVYLLLVYYVLKAMGLWRINFIPTDLSFVIKWHVKATEKNFHNDIHVAEWTYIFNFLQVQTKCNMVKACFLSSLICLTKI